MPTDAGWIPARLQRFHHAVEGVAAIEFAMLFPVLLVLYMGTVDASLGFSIHRKVKHAASTMSDLVTRETNVTKSDLDGILVLGDAMVSPRAARLDSAKISAIYVDSTGKAKVAWSRARNTTADAVGTVITLPADLASLRNFNLIRANVSYLYRPMGGFGLTGPYQIDKELYNAARIGDGVTCSDCPS